MGSASSVESVRGFESSVQRLGDLPLDEAGLVGIFGSDVANMRLFDLLKDPESGKVDPAELREIIRAKRAVGEKKRKEQVFAAGSAVVSSKARDQLVKEAEVKAAALKDVEAQKREFQERMKAAAENGGSRPLDPQVA